MFLLQSDCFPATDSDGQVKSQSTTTVPSGTGGPTGVLISATLSGSAGGSPPTSLHFDGATTGGPITVPNLPCLSFGPMALTADMTFKPFALNDVSLSGSVDVCGAASATGSFAYNKSSGETDFSIEIDPVFPSPFQVCDDRRKFGWGEEKF